MGVTFTFLPFVESDIDHYNVYRSDMADVPTFEKIGQVPHVAGLTPLSFTDDTGAPTIVYRIASSLADQTELLVSCSFTTAELNGRARIFGRCTDIGGRPVPRVKAEFALSVPQAIRDGSVISRSVAVYADEQGNWFVDLIPNARLLPIGTSYWVQLDNGRGDKTIPIVVPMGALLIYYPSLVTIL